MSNTPKNESVENNDPDAPQLSATWAEVPTDRVEGQGPDLSDRIREKREYARSIAAEQAPEAVSHLEDEIREKHEYRRSAAAEQAPQTIQIPADYDKYIDYGDEINSPEVHEPIPPLYPLDASAGSRRSRQDDDSVTQAVSDREQGSTTSTTSSRRRSRICGLRRTTFWLLLALVVVAVIAATVGGVLGGVLSARSRDRGTKESSSTPTSTGPSTPAPADASQTSMPVSVSSTATESLPFTEPTVVDFYKELSYNFTMWEELDFKGNWQYFDRVGYYKLAFRAKSYLWQSGLWVDAKKCSIAYCDGDSWYGYRGGNDWAMSNPSASAWPDHVKIVCGARFSDPGCKPPEETSATWTRPTFPASLSPPTPTTTGTLMRRAMGLEFDASLTPRTRLV